MRRVAPWSRVEVVGLHRLIAALLLSLAAAWSAAAQTPPAAALLEQLQHVEADVSQTFKVTDIHMRRDAVRLHLQHGTLMFLQPVAGRVTGALFEGAGEVLVVPPDRAERHQLLKFTGSPILTESFARVYLRFSDSTFEELREQIRSGRGRPAHEPALARQWAPLMDGLNRAHALRLLLDYADARVNYFYAGVEGQRLGTFNVVVDDRRAEQILVGQVRWRDGLAYYDVWCSFARPEGPAGPPAARALAYRIRSTLSPTTELEVECETDLALGSPHPQALLFELSRFLQVSEVAALEGETAAPLPFFQNFALSAEEARYRGTDVVAVLLPPASLAAAEKDTLTLRFRYRGRVITDLGNGVLFVGARGNWYPVINAAFPARFTLRFRTPLPLQLVATGALRSVEEHGEWKESLWVSEGPLPVAGFNVGDYESREVERGGVRIAAYANRQLEPALAQAAPRSAAPRVAPHGDPWAQLRPDLRPAPSAPTMLLDQVLHDVAAAVDTYTELFGPFPYAALHISQIPGRFGQGYPGLIYLSTYSFLPDADQERLGLSERARGLFSQLTPAHEAAHQWWGNAVRVPAYRDQWLAESLAAYSALLYLERQPDGPPRVRQWLERYRQDLLEVDAEGERADNIGALSLGARLDSSRSPEGFTQLIYSKGPWVIHMLREMLRDPGSGSDEVFLSALRRLAARGGSAPLITADFQAALETVLPAHADAEKNGQLDWFFQQWVFDTGIPRYRLEWRLGGDGQVEGTIEQSEVSPLFTMPVPVYARYGERLEPLGQVVVTGEQAAFRFPVRARPDAVVLDPHGAVLTLPD